VFIKKEEHEVCVVRLVPLGGKPKDTVELVFPYVPNHLVLEYLMLAGYTVTLSMDYRSVNVRVKADAVAKVTRNPKKTEAIVEEPGETIPPKPQQKKRSSRKAEAEVALVNDDADFVPTLKLKMP